MLSYKGYTGYVEFDNDAELFHGEVIDTVDVITFEGETAREIKKAFKESVDDYLDFCTARGEEPNKPFSGKLELNISPALHHQIFIHARQTGKTINSFINDTLRKTADI